MRVRAIGLGALLLSGAISTLGAQAFSRQPSADGQRASFEQLVVHNGKWLAAASVAAFTIAAASEHRLSRREWNSLLIICRSAQDACTLGADGRYVRADAEARYQRSRGYDRRANRWLVGAQLTLIATTALFIIDLHPGRGPENIPFPAQIRVGAVGDGAAVEMRIAF